MSTSGRIDHLVVAAPTLDEGAAWCERTLGVDPGAGGVHPLMGTHNRLLRIATVNHPRAYLEIIAIDPGSAGAADGRRRWFDLDDPALQAGLRAQGPRLVHWVAQVADVRAAVQAWRDLGLDPGEVVTASRPTPRGLLQWQITVRRDGRRLLDGCLPALIEWGDTHPAAALPDSGVTLHGLGASHPQPQVLRAAFAAIGVENVAVEDGSARLCATLHTPAGPRRLSS
ncbi:MAG TPA: VOC family protein [Ramlibacter sp.]|uniref:VOC family protein n=1 Tax=Ramlibacter sp. TaxID=1917967 RepID=UPI002D2B1D28|nr:VOC family protein [Ramlibacter sp.]HZY16977.1 VOC family protein [Ramlibacter sp.]